MRPCKEFISRRHQIQDGLLLASELLRIRDSDLLQPTNRFHDSLELSALFPTFSGTNDCLQVVKIDICQSLSVYVSLQEFHSTEGHDYLVQVVIKATDVLQVVTSYLAPVAPPFGLPIRKLTDP